MTKEQVLAELRLFKSYTDDSVLRVHETINNDALRKGVLFTQPVSDEVLNCALDLYGKKPEEWNATFHKSFQTVLETPLEELYAQQIVHYFTTYGLEALDLYNSDLVYIPKEQLEIPELEGDIPLVVIHQITALELGSRLLKLLTSGIALSKTTIEDVMLLSDYIDRDRFDEIANREVKIALYDKYGVTPKNNVEYLRYIIYKLTGGTLLIQNKETIEKLKHAPSYDVYRYLQKYVTEVGGTKRLAQIFQRYKNLFLALKRDRTDDIYGEQINAIINRISKVSKKCHVPVGNNILDNLTKISDIDVFNLAKSHIQEELDKATIYREIRIINAFRLNIQQPLNCGVYKIRNGKCYVKDKGGKKPSVTQKYVWTEILNFIMEHLKTRLNKLVGGKTVYIPKNVMYSAPTSEKQFVNNMPEGSYIEIPRNENIVVGVHWYNLKDYRVDLDLHALNRTEHYGWNALYRSEGSDIAFSGDITDACGPNGACEVFLIKSALRNKSFLLTVNDFRNTPKSVPFDFIISHISSDTINKNYMVDPNKVVCTIHNSFDKDTPQKDGKPEMTLGFVDVQDGSVKFYFMDFELTRSIASNQSELTMAVFDYINAVKNTQLTLKDLLVLGGAELVDAPYVEKLVEVKMLDVTGEQETLYRKETQRCDIDLSIEQITKSTFIDLLQEK